MTNYYKRGARGKYLSKQQIDVFAKRNRQLASLPPFSDQSMSDKSKLNFYILDILTLKFLRKRWLHFMTEKAASAMMRYRELRKAGIADVDILSNDDILYGRKSVQEYKIQREANRRATEIAQHLVFAEKYRLESEIKVAQDLLTKLKP